MLAIISIVALIAVIIISCITERVNIGILATTVALTLALALTNSTVKQIAGSFPAELFLMMISVCLLFGFAVENGSLRWITHRLLFRIEGKPYLYPPLFFILTFILSAVGPGNIAATAIVAPIAMGLAAELKLNPFLMAILVCTGANAGALSPIAPTGVVASGLLQQIGVTDGSIGMAIFIATALMHTLSAVGAFILLGRQTKAMKAQAAPIEQLGSLSRMQLFTLIVIAVAIVSILFFKVPLVVAALLGSCVLGFAGAASGNMLRKLPWDTILMVSGMSILMGMVEKFGGLDLSTTLLAKLQLGFVLHGALALITGSVSAYSSSSGVVMPAFMPLIPGLLEKINVGTTASLAIAIAVGAHMVDVSPLSTLGALTIAAYPDPAGRVSLFKKLMIWGLSMCLVGGILAYIFLDVLKMWQ